MTQPEHWMAYIRGKSATSPNLDHEEALARGLIPSRARVTAPLS